MVSLKDAENARSGVRQETKPSKISRNSRITRWRKETSAPTQFFSSLLGKTGAPVIENQIACCRALLGEPAKAIEISKAVLPRLESMGPEYGASGHLVLGIANFTSGRSSEAIPYLQKAYTASTDVPARKAMAAFYLGEAFSALGKSSDAREAYQHAQGDLPTSPFAMRALERLK